MTCKHYLNCRHYCAVTESCDYLINTGERRPCPAADCRGYPIELRRSTSTLLLPGSYIFDPVSGLVRGRLHG